MPGRDRWTRLLLALGGVAGYALAFAPIYHRTGAIVAAASLAPVAVAGWLLGIWGGLFIGLLCIPLNALLFTLVGVSGWKMLIAYWPGTAAFVAAGVLIGWMRNLIRQGRSRAGALTREQALLIRELEREIGKRQRTEEALRSSHEKMRKLSAHLETVREEERKKIAREVHDELGRLLTALKFDLSWLAKRVPAEPGDLAAKVGAMDRLIDDSITTVQRISAELRPRLLDDLGLVAAIEWQAQEFTTRTGMPCAVVAAGDGIEIGQQGATVLFRIFQECLTNIIRHAGASRVDVSLDRTGGGIVLEVADNGRGITEAEISSPHAYGLMGMQERASLHGGEALITGEAGKGTRVRVSIPTGGNDADTDRR